MGKCHRIKYKYSLKTKLWLENCFIAYKISKYCENIRKNADYIEKWLYFNENRGFKIRFKERKNLLKVIIPVNLSEMVMI